LEILWLQKYRKYKSNYSEDVLQNNKNWNKIVINTV